MIARLRRVYTKSLGVPNHRDTGQKCARGNFKITLISVIHYTTPRGTSEKIGLHGSQMTVDVVRSHRGGVKPQAENRFSRMVFYSYCLPYNNNIYKVRGGGRDPWIPSTTTPKSAPGVWMWTRYIESSKHTLNYQIFLFVDFSTFSKKKYLKDETR